ncbi:MAG TPA: hypothetical protein PKA28_02345 [Methylomusa anaerophila]|nr:hypothetical protein [Methylomusa anaerophila]HML87274.1 hypothetical protein [Methylomusa anaerophila]
MRSKFWQGLIWGSLVATALGAIIGPKAKAKRKPLLERSAAAVTDTTRDLMRGARRARKRLMKKMD